MRTVYILQDGATTTSPCSRVGKNTNTTSPCSRVGKNTNTTSHRMCMSKYSISQRKSKSLIHLTSQDVNQRTTTRNSPKLISQSHVIASTHMTRRHMVQYKSQYRNITPFSGGMPTFLNSKVNKGPTAHDPDRQCPWRVRETVPTSTSPIHPPHATSSQIAYAPIG